MTRWEVRGTEGTVEVDAPNWMMAAGSAMESLGLSGLELACLICDIQPDGIVRIFDPKQGQGLLVRRADGPPAAPDPLDEPVAEPSLAAPKEAEPQQVVAVGEEEPAEEAQAAPEEDESEALPSAPPPLLSMPTPSLGDWLDAGLEEASEPFDADDLAFIQAPEGADEEAPEGLAEELFEATFDIAGADDPQTAAEAALQVLLQHVPAESAAVLYASINDVGLRFLAAQGPQADSVRAITVPFDRGIAGFSHTQGADLIVRNVRADPRHMGEVDEQSGYRTRSMLVAALRDQDGHVHGCIELLNAPSGFRAWHLDATRTVAQPLAETLGRQS